MTSVQTSVQKIFIIIPNTNAILNSVYPECRLNNLAKVEVASSNLVCRSNLSELFLEIIRG